MSEAVFTASGQILSGTGTNTGQTHQPALGHRGTVHRRGASLIVGTGSGTGELLTNGTTGQVLTANTGAAPSWAAATGGGAPPNDGPTNVLGETVPRLLATGTSAAAPLNGFIICTLIPLYAGQVVGHLAYSVQSGASVPLNQWLGLYSLAGVQLATTADQTTATIANATYYSYAIAAIASGAASSYTVPTTGLYYIGLAITATSQPTIVTPNSTVTNSTLGAVLPYTCATAGPSFTGPPTFPTTLTLAAGTTRSFWAAALT